MKRILLIIAVSAFIVACSSQNEQQPLPDDFTLESVSEIRGNTYRVVLHKPTGQRYVIAGRSNGIAITPLLQPTTK